MISIRMSSTIFVASLVFSMVCHVGRSDGVFASSAHLQILAEEEKKLVTFLKTYIDYERQRIEYFQRLLLEVEEVQLDPKLAFPGNPINALRLIRRFITLWNDVHRSLQDPAPAAEFQNIRNGLSFFWPTLPDYDGAKLALIRLQRTYNLSTSDLLAGNVADHVTNQPLSQQMALEIAMSATENGFYNEAFSFLTEAQRHLVQPLSSAKDLLLAIGNTYLKKGASELGADTSDVAHRDSTDVGTGALDSVREPHAEDWPHSEPNYEILCREFMSASKTSQLGRSDLSCTFKRSTNAPFYRFKVEILHNSPDVVLFHDFVSDAESEALRNMATVKLQRAQVGSTTSSRPSNERIGKIAWFWDSEGDKLTNEMSRRISDVTGLNVSDPFGEALQLSNYGIGGHYHLHYDHDAYRFQSNETSPEIQAIGDRIATFMIYLNNVDAGGATVFPKLNLAAKPTKNAAIFWYNYKHNGEQDERTLHAACPVLIGQKWVANKWVREFGQEFRRPCEAIISS